MEIIRSIISRDDYNLLMTFTNFTFIVIMQFLGKRLSYIILSISFLFIVSCADNDDFSTDSSLQLTFPKEAVSLGTVFMEVPSPVRIVKVYNPNNKSITFDEIALDDSENNFRLLVNGRPGTSFSDIELLKKDTLYLFIDAFAQKDFSVVDKNLFANIFFSWNGNTEKINLEALAKNVEIIDDLVIAQNQTFSKDVYLKGNLIVNENVTLSLTPGLTIYADRKASIGVNGTIDANGTLEKPITFRGHRFDFIEGEIPYDNVPEQWVGMSFGSNSFANIFNHVVLKNAKYGLMFAPSVGESEKIRIENSILQNFAETGITASGATIRIANSLIANAKDALLNISGGHTEILYTTIANYYSWKSRTQSSLVLTDQAGGVNVPVTEFRMINSLLVGRSLDEFMLDLSSSSAKPYIAYSLIQSSGRILSYPIEKDNLFVYNTGKSFPFQSINKDGLFYYDFRLTENSVAIGQADIGYNSFAPLDLDGFARSATSSDLGCYVYH